MDVLYIGIIVVSFALTLGLTALCERLDRGNPGGKS
ncbi:MAG: potassium ABC transporter ATPase [Bacteroidota bacterium]